MKNSEKAINRLLFHIDKIREMAEAGFRTSSGDSTYSFDAIICLAEKALKEVNESKIGKPLNHV